MKIVVSFYYDKGINKLVNEYQKSYDEQIDAKINERLAGFFTDFSFEKKVDYTEIDMGDGIWYEIYPSVLLYGDSGISDSEWNVKHDNLIAEFRIILLDFLQSPTIGATNIHWHIHYSWGSADIDEP